MILLNKGDIFSKNLDKCLSFFHYFLELDRYIIDISINDYYKFQTIPNNLKEKLDNLYKKFQLNAEQIKIIENFQNFRLNEAKVLTNHYAEFINIINEENIIKYFDLVKSLTEFANVPERVVIGIQELHIYTIQEINIIFFKNPFGLYNLLFEDILNLLVNFTSIYNLQIILLNMSLYTSKGITQNPPASKIIGEFEAMLHDNRKYHLTSTKIDFVKNRSILAAIFHSYHRNLSNYVMKKSYVLLFYSKI